MCVRAGKTDNRVDNYTNYYWLPLTKRSDRAIAIAPGEIKTCGTEFIDGAGRSRDEGRDRSLGSLLPPPLRRLSILVHRFRAM